MSSKEAEFITQWNGLLDYKIDEQSLRKPNFQFFYYALESLMRSLNFDIEAAKENSKEQSDPDRAYFIMFCSFVHRLYQLSDASFNFYYYDLVNPSESLFFLTFSVVYFVLSYFFFIYVCSIPQRPKRVFMCSKCCSII